MPITKRKTNEPIALNCETLEPRMMLSTVQLSAAGFEGTEQINLLVDDVAVATYTLNDGGTTANFETFTYNSDATIIADQVKVEFINDAWDPIAGIDANVRLNSIAIDGTVYETEDPSVFSTGTWLPADDIQPGFRQSEILHVNGFFQFAGGVIVDPPSSGSIVINEIHYNPGPGLEVDPDAEFVELYNTTDAAIDLSGMSFTGFDLTFADGTTLGAGEYAIVSPSISIAQATWGVTPIGEFTAGGISGGGELIQLLGADGVTVIDEVAYDDVNPWPGTPDGNGPSLELKNFTLDNSLPDSWGGSDGDPTPGAQNSIFGASVVDLITNIAVTPGTPLPNVDFAISANIDGATTATLTYKIDFGNDVTVAMVNTGGDVWTANVPGQTEGTLVRYRIESDVEVAPFDDTINYFGVVVQNPSVVGNQLPIFEFFVDEAEFINLTTTELALTNTKIAAVVSYGGQVIDNATVRVRGGDFSRANFPKKSLKFELPDGYTLDFGTGYGVDEFGINADYSEWNWAGTDIAWDVWNAESQSQTQSFHVRAQNNGEFHGVFRFQELYDGAWREANGFKDDEFYKAGGGAFGLNPQFDKKTPDDGDFSSIIELNEILKLENGSESQRAWLYENVNVPAMINHMALSALTRHDDQDVQNFYVAKDAQSGLWETIEWDLDRLWGDNEDTPTPIPFTDVAYIDEPFMNAVFAVPEFEDMYWRRMQTLVDTYLSPEGVNEFTARRDQLIAEIGATNSTLEFDKWGRVDIFQSNYFRESFIADIQGRVTSFANETRLPGSATGQQNVVITELHYNPAGTDAEFIELFNNSNESIDLSGWTIDGIGLTIEYGTVILPNEYIVFTDNMPQFKNQYPGNIFVAGQYPGGLSGGGEAITLINADGVTVDTVVYDDVAPWPTAPDGAGNTLALTDVNSDNNVAANWAASTQINGTPGLDNSAVITSSVIKVFAAGLEGDEQISLDLFGEQVAFFDLGLAGGQAGDLTARNFTEFSFVTSETVTPADVRVNFLNDSYDPITQTGRDVAIDRIEIDGVAFETENPAVFSTGSYVNGVLTSGFLETEILQTNGYFQYAEPVVADPSLLTIRAAGATGNEIISLEIAGTVVATYDLALLGGQAGDLATGNFIELTYQADGPINASDVRINFVNDVYDEAAGIDYNVGIDNIKIGDVVFETEAPTTYSTGTWLPEDGVVPGFRQSEVLTNAGYFQYLFDPSGNTTPVAANDEFSTTLNTAVSGNVLTNDSDQDPGDTISVVSNTNPANGTVTVGTDGSFTYTPTTGYVGSDSFNYTIADGSNATATGTVNITIEQVIVNTDPVAVDDVNTTAFETAVTGRVLTNDSDVDAGDILTVISNTPPSNGDLFINATGFYVYTPNTGFSGTDSFTYTISDGNNGTATATVTITVEDAPSPFVNGNIIELRNVGFSNAYLAAYSSDEVITQTNSTSRTRWELIDNDGDGQFLIRNVGTGEYLDGDSNEIEMSSSSVGIGKEWEFIEISPGQYHLSNVFYDEIVDANGTFAYVQWDPGASETDDLWTVTVV
ncbi:MAG: Ig-like domain-containing protein [Mariniblastus sp.]